MVRIKCAAWGIGNVYLDRASLHDKRVGAFAMSKKYELVRDRIPLPRGGFIEAFRMALVDLACFGEGRRMDLTGYPHESEAAAMMSDWAALGVDIRAAVKRIESFIGDEGERDGGGEGRPEKARQGHAD